MASNEAKEKSDKPESQDDPNPVDPPRVKPKVVSTANNPAPNNQSKAKKRNRNAGNQPGAKKPRFPSYAKTGENSHVSVIEPTGRMIPVMEHFRVQISLLGLDRVIDACYDIIKSRENRFPDPPYTRDQFRHVCYLAAFFKLYYGAIELGEYNPREYPSIIDDCKTLEAAWLPSIICDYIDCIGAFTAEDGRKFIPFTPTMEEFFGSPFNPFYILDEHGVRTEVHCTLDDFMDQYPVGTFNRWNLRAKQLLGVFTHPKICSSDGLAEITVTAYRDLNSRRNRLLPRSFIKFDEAVGRRGAAFAFWSSEDMRDQGDYDYCVDFFGGETFDPDVYISTIVNASIC